MDYAGPQSADLIEVKSLNLATLRLARSETAGARLRRALPGSLQPQVLALTDLQIGRLAGSPFLLLTLRESDDVYWDQVFTDNPHRDLFANTDQGSRESNRIVSAAAGFLWHLARRNPYAARLVCGASLALCERLASCSLFELLHRTADRDDLPGLRLADNEAFWRRLLEPGLSSDVSIRSAAQLCALQSALTDATVDSGRLSAAACRAAVPTLTVSAGVDVS